MAKTGYPCIKNNPTLSCATCADRRPDIWANNRDVWLLWAKVHTQWRIAGMDGVPIGLDYNAVKIVAETLDIVITPANLTKLQALENATLTKYAAAKGGINGK